MIFSNKKLIIKFLLVIIIISALLLQYIYGPKHEEGEIGFPKQIFNAIKNNI